MGEENKDFSPLNLLEYLKAQSHALLKKHNQELNLGLTLGGSYATRTPSESGVLVRAFSLNEKRCTVKYSQQDVSSGQQQLARTMSLPPDVEAEKMMPKETKASNRMEAMKRISAKEKGIERLSRIPEEEEEVEERETVEVGEEGRLGNWVVESPANNTTFRRAIGKLKSAQGLENSNAERMASSKANSEANEIGESAYYPYRNNESGNPVIPYNSHAHAVAFPLGRTPRKMPVTRGSENPPKKAKFLTLSGDSCETPTSMMDLKGQMPSVAAFGPTGNRLEGILFKFGAPEQIVIACNCHGQFLSVVEFIRHAGWAGVANPMQHIKVMFPDL